MGWTWALWALAFLGLGLGFGLGPYLYFMSSFNFEKTRRNNFKCEGGCLLPPLIKASFIWFSSPRPQWRCVQQRSALSQQRFGGGCWWLTRRKAQGTPHFWMRRWAPPWCQPSPPRLRSDWYIPSRYRLYITLRQTSPTKLVVEPYSPGTAPWIAEKAVRKMWYGHLEGW